MKYFALALIITLGSSFGNIHAQSSDVLKPADNNEARLNRHQPPEQVMDVFGIKPGMTVAEIGAGRGRYVVHLAKRVGENGKVYAEDISKSSLDFCEKRCEQGGLKNVEIVHGGVTDPKLPEGELDMIFIISSYHHFDDPVALMKTARKALKPGGKVAIGEWANEKDSNLREGRSPAQLEKEMKQAGYKLEKVDKSLEEENMYLYLFTKRKVE